MEEVLAGGQPALAPARRGLHEHVAHRDEQVSDEQRDEQPVPRALEANGWHDDELDGVRVFTPGGDPIGHISLPERCANLCFGGRYRNRLFMAASHGLYALYVNTQGVAGG